MAENLNLSKTIVMPDPSDGTKTREYNINAVYSDEANKVTNHLIVKESGRQAFDFDGSTSSQTIDYVPADKGGTFANPVYLSNPTSTPRGDEVITSGQVDNRILELKKSEPLCLWDTSFQPTDISKSLYLLKDSEDKAYKFTIITGTESDFYLLQDALKGDFDIVSQDLTYDIINYLSLSFGWKTGQLASTASGVIVVPDKYTGKYFKPDSSGLGSVQSSEPTTQKVTEIAESTFKNNTKITSIVLPETIEIIGSRAFYGCTNLKSIIIPNSARSITALSQEASTVESWFEGCTKLHKVIFSDGEFEHFTDIGPALFRNCTSLTSIVIPKNVKTIGEEAFSGCTSLTSIVIPESVTSIADNAFVDCSNLSTIYYTGSEAQWNSLTISATGNTSISNAAKVYDYIVTDQSLSEMPSASIDIAELNKGPFIYICKEEESADTPASNKVFLKLPGETGIVELSKGAARLETPRDAKVSGYYTYETLAAIIAGINTRLDGLGGATLKLPTALPTGDTIIQEDLHTTVLGDTFTEETAKEVPTVYQLQEAVAKICGLKDKDGEDIANIQGVIDNCTDSLAEIREDLNNLAAEVVYDLAGGESHTGAAIEYANTRIDKLEDGRIPVSKALALSDTVGTPITTAKHVPVYFENGVPVACGNSSGEDGDDNLVSTDGSVPINISGNAKTATFAQESVDNSSIYQKLRRCLVVESFENGQLYVTSEILAEPDEPEEG